MLSSSVLVPWRLWECKMVWLKIENERASASRILVWFFSFHCAIHNRPNRCIHCWVATGSDAMKVSSPIYFLLQQIWHLQTEQNFKLFYEWFSVDVRYLNNFSFWMSCITYWKINTLNQIIKKVSWPRILWHNKYFVQLI